MGLDVFVGPLSRYYTGDWETVVQQMGRQTGMPITVIRPKAATPSFLSRLVAALTRRNPTPDSAQRVTAWAASLTQYSPEATTFAWSDSPSAPYFTDKPAWDCYGALMLWAAYDELKPSDRLASAKHWDRDASYLAVIQKSDSKYRHLVANTELWLPVAFEAPFSAPSPGGNEVVIGSSIRLLAELECLNANTWRASGTDLESWRHSGAAYDAPLEVSARFGFAVFHGLAKQSVSANLPMKLDY